MSLSRPLSVMLTLSLIVVVGRCAESPAEPRRTSADLARNDNPLSGESAGGITAPVGGTAPGAKFQGTLTITGSRFNEDLGPVLVGNVKGILVVSTSNDAGPTESVVISAGDMEFNYNDDVKTDDDCITIEFSPPPVTHEETKTTIELNAVIVQTRTLPGPRNLIADLICAPDRAMEGGWTMDKSGGV